MGFYRYHLFFCCNQRPEGETCCANHGAERLLDYARDRVAALGEAIPGPVRLNKAGCLGRCDLGPVLVVYPDGVWYTYLDEGDLDEIIDRHLGKGEVVERLRLSDA